MQIVPQSVFGVQKAHQNKSKPMDPAKSQVALLIMDRGGGIPFERQPHVWSSLDD